jgi:hypothetical protein
MSTLLGILAEKISILRSFCRIFCWGGWRFEKFFNWCSFGLFQFEGDLVGFFGIEIFSLWIGGVFFLHCFDYFLSWKFLGRKHVLLIELLMLQRFCGFCEILRILFIDTFWKAVNFFLNVGFEYLLIL